MKKPKIRPAHGPEYGIQNDVVKMLRSKGWHIERLVGMAYQFGLPDLLIGHPQWGIRFVELKQEDHYRFTIRQRWKFPVLMRYGMGIWILTEATEEQYERLFHPPNLWDYMKKEEIIDQQVVDDIVDSLTE